MTTTKELSVTRPNPSSDSKSDRAILAARAAARDGREPVKTRQPGDAALLAKVEAAEHARRQRMTLDERFRELDALQARMGSEALPDPWLTR